MSGPATPLCAAPGCFTVPRKDPIYCHRHRHLRDVTDSLAEASHSESVVSALQSVPSGAERITPREAVARWTGQYEWCRDITREAADAWLSGWEPDFSPDQQELIDAIDRAAIEFDAPWLYRGVDLDVDEWLVSNFDHMTEEGQVYEFPAPQSFSYERDTAEGFAYLDGNALRPVVIKVKPGPLRAVDRFDYLERPTWCEGEYVIPANTGFQVIESFIDHDEESDITTRRITLQAVS